MAAIKSVFSERGKRTKQVVFQVAKVELNSVGVGKTESCPSVCLSVSESIGSLHRQMLAC